MPSKSKRFPATIYKIWMLRYVDVPEKVSAALAKARGSPPGKARKRAKPSHVPVIAIVDGRSARTSMVSAGAGRYRLPLNTALRKAARADAGDVVSVELRLDRASRSLPVPPDLRAALQKHATARRTFEKLPPGLRRQFLLWFGAAKSPEARTRRLERAIDHLLERALLRPRSRPARHNQRHS
jgi:hypothetical protein